MIFKWAIVLLAKILHAVYSETSYAFLIPILSYVLRETKELTGKQESTISFVQTATIQ